MTDAEILDAIKSVCGFDLAEVEKWRSEALMIGRAVEQAANREWMAKCEELRKELKESQSLLDYIEKRARTTDYDGGWTGVWDIRGVPAWNDVPSNKFNHRKFLDAIKAEMAKKEGA